MFDLIASVLSFFYDLIPDYAAAIALLTLAVMVVLTPLTLKSTRSMLKMQAMAPEMKKLQAQYADDRQKMNEEMMKFYSENGINPLGGCLPMLLQLPVFFILYQVVQGLTRRTNLLDAVAQGTPEAAGTFDPRYLDQGSALYDALHTNTEMISFGIDLSRTALQAVGDGLGSGWPYIVLVLLTAATSYVQQAQIQRRSTAAINPQMQMITKLLPAFFVVISLSIPAAVVIYFVVSGLYRIGQQQLITHSIYKPHNATVGAAAGGGAIDTTGTEDAPRRGKGGDAALGTGADTATPRGKGSPSRTGGQGSSKRPAGKGGPASKPSAGTPTPARGASSRGTPTKGPKAGRTKPAGATPAANGRDGDVEPAAEPPAKPRTGLLGRLAGGGGAAATPDPTPEPRSGAARTSGRVTPAGSRSTPNRPTKKKKRK